MPRFFAKEGDGENRRDRAHDLAGIAHQSARNIDRNDRQSSARGSSQGFRRRSFERAAESCAEERIDH